MIDDRDAEIAQLKADLKEAQISRENAWDRMVETRAFQRLQLRFMLFTAQSAEILTARHIGQGHDEYRNEWLALKADAEKWLQEPSKLGRRNRHKT